MGLHKTKTIQDVQDIVTGINPPETLTEIARMLGFSRPNPLAHLLQEPTREAPNGYEIVFRPTLRIKP
jgi:hypothetical protein